MDYLKKGSLLTLLLFAGAFTGFNRGRAAFALITTFALVRSATGFRGAYASADTYTARANKKGSGGTE
jgi:hypothetical protein